MLMQIDGTFIFVIISFLIFLFIIRAILYRPITKVIEERNNYYAKNSKMEVESTEKAKQLIEQKQELIRNARNEAGVIVKETSENAKNKSEKDIKYTKKRINDEVKNNENNLIQQSKNAKEEIKNEMTSIVKLIVSKILNEEIEIKLDEEKIKQHLNI